MFPSESGMDRNTADNSECFLFFQLYWMFQLMNIWLVTMLNAKFSFCFVFFAGIKKICLKEFIELAATQGDFSVKTKGED